MSRKDYEVIAGIFGQTLANHLGEGERAIWDAVILFEEKALSDNPRFDRSRFEKAIREIEELHKEKI
jgi:hypothetical protein